MSFAAAITNRSANKTLLLVLLVLCCGLAGCGGSKMLREPQEITLAEPLAAAADPRVGVVLDLVIVRDGPGTWAKNADWDEYRIRVVNQSDEAVSITRLEVYDSLGARLNSSGDRKALLRGSKDTARRYEGEGLEVKAGLGGAALMAVGGASYVAGYGLGMAALYGSAPVGAAGVAIGALVLAPVLAVGGIVRGVNNSKVSQEINKRQTALPLNVEPGTTGALTGFFPLAPSPQRVEIGYTDAAGQHVLVIDTSERLRGLHLRTSDEAPDETLP